MEQQPPDQAQRPPQAQQPAHRDMMFCHECHDEWYRDEHGLTCPQCGSDFTEIIEENNDPRDAHDAHDEDDHELEHAHPPFAVSPLHLFGLPPFPPPSGRPGNDAEDPEEGDISNIQFRQVGPGRFTMTGAVFRTVSPSGRQEARPVGADGNQGTGPLGGITSLLGNLIRGGGQAQNQNANQPGGQSSQGPGQEGQNPQGQNPPGQNPQGQTTGTLPGGHRFTYTAGARLLPRDANNPGPHMEPVDELNNVLVGLMAAFGEPPGHHHHEHFRGGPVHINPLVHLFAHMIPGHGQVGDAVYSQEALDRIITQLMEQNASSNAPPPASEQEIEALPRKEIVIEDLGSEGKAECSICMEEVNIGEQVTQLPCRHWFHHPCIKAWLSEHDTCPHCRKGISKPREGAGDANQSGNSAGAPGSSPPRQMPGSFTGEGTSDNPYVLPSSPPDTHMHGTEPDSQARQGSTGESSSAGGLGDRLRRGLFGP